MAGLVEEITEDRWDAQLFRGPKALAVLLGWNRSYHTLRSKGSQPGFPDRVIVRDRCIFAELKRDLTGKASVDRARQPTDRQREWLDDLSAAGMEVYLWRPADLQEVAKILGHPWKFHRPGLLVSPRDQFAPVSSWIPGVGRVDEAP